MKFILKGYNDKDATFHNKIVTVEVFADTEEEAITKAKGICKKDTYSVSMVIEAQPKLTLANNE